MNLTQLPPVHEFESVKAGVYALYAGEHLFTVYICMVSAACGGGSYWTLSHSGPTYMGRDHNDAVYDAVTSAECMKEAKRMLMEVLPA